MTTWVITHDGKHAWPWENPAWRVPLIDEIDIEEFIKTRLARGDKIVDDRKSHPVTYNED